MKDVEIRVPDLGTTTDEIEVVQWLVRVGEQVTLGQPLLVVETDKASMELESVAAGTLKQIIAEPGQEVATGEVLAIVASEGAALPAMSTPSTTTAPAPRLQKQAVRQLDNALAIPDVDIDGYDNDFLLSLYERMALIRTFEERVKLLFLEGSMPGTIHQCQGQEACAVGVCAALNQDDFITSTFRGHGHALAKGVTVEGLLYELFGALSGCCKGKGGSMHVGDMSIGMVPGIAIVGGGVPIAAGMGLAFKMQKSSQVVASFFGDGAIAEGAFHEGINLAAIWDLPVVYVCENNHYGASTRVDKVMRNQRISERAATYGIHAKTIDGNDVLAVYETARKAVELCRDAQGPVLLELLTYRRTGHSRRDACHYQPSEERDYWMSRDPITLLGVQLVERRGVTQNELDELQTKVNQQFDDALAAVPDQPMPTVDDLTTDLWV